MYQKKIATNPYFSIFDFESFTIPVEREYLGRQFHASQEPATFSICSNVPEHTEAVYVRTYGTSQELVDQSIIELLKQQETRKIISTEKYLLFLDALDHMEVEIKSKLGIQEEEPKGQEEEEEDQGKRPKILNSPYSN